MRENKNARMQINCRTRLNSLRVEVEQAITSFIIESGCADLMLKNCVLFHFIDDDDSEFISRALADGTVAIDSMNETYYLHLREISLDLLISILDELQEGRFIPMDVELPEVAGVICS